MTTEIHIRAEIHNEEKVVHVKVGDQPAIVLLPGEQTRTHVFEGQAIVITEEDANTADADNEDQSE